ncbi:MAG: hypothetical protein WDZ83_12545 [Rhizobiaceae bacterium]
MRHAYLISLVTGERIECSIDDHTDFEYLEIQPDEFFRIGARFRNELGLPIGPRGLTVSTFRKNWITFKLVIECEGFSVERTYDAELVDWLLYDVFTLHLQERPLPEKHNVVVKKPTGAKA